MSIENEVSFTIKSLPADISKYPKKEIEQGYFSDLPSPLRIRNEGGLLKITKKVPINPSDLSRVEETEVEIKKEEFDLLWPLRAKTISKTRIYYPLENNLVAEIDFYHGPLEGFVSVEVEFPNNELRANFQPPDWFGKDISTEVWATNSVLADMNLAEVNKKLI